jgi:hypothetical protein
LVVVASLLALMMTNGRELVTPSEGVRKNV